MEYMIILNGSISKIHNRKNVFHKPISPKDTIVFNFLKQIHKDRYMPSITNIDV